MQNQVRPESMERITTPELAKAFIDFITSKDAQTIITTQLNRRSVRKDVPAPSYLTPKEDINIIYDDPELVVEKKEEWLTKFNDIFTSF